jgi:hypothetical protein
MHRERYPSKTNSIRKSPDFGERILKGLKFKDSKMWSGEIKLNQGNKIIVGVTKMTGTFVALYEPDITN